MSIAVEGTGPSALARAIWSQVHPVFMLPPLAATWFGAVLGGNPGVEIAGLHSVAIFLAVYTAHVKDGYIDYYVRGEDATHPLTAGGCRAILAVTAVGFFGCILALWAVAGPAAALITLPTWFLGYLHAPQLDMNPVTATAGYPVGIGLSLLGGYVSQYGTVTGPVTAYAVVLVLLLVGIKIIDDEQDYRFDRAIEKRTVAVCLGCRPARRVAFGSMGIGLAGVLGAVVGGLFPIGSLLAPLVFIGIMVIASRAPPTIATMLLIRGAYVFLAILVAMAWFAPFRWL